MCPTRLKPGPAGQPPEWAALVTLNYWTWESGTERREIRDQHRKEKAKAGGRKQQQQRDLWSVNLEGHFTLVHAYISPLGFPSPLVLSQNQLVLCPTLPGHPQHQPLPFTTPIIFSSFDPHYMTCSYLYLVTIRLCSLGYYISSSLVLFHSSEHNLNFHSQTWLHRIFMWLKCQTPHST